MGIKGNKGCSARGTREEEAAAGLCSHLLVAPRESSQRNSRFPLCMIIKFRAVAKTSPSFCSFRRFNRGGNEWKRDYCHLCNCFVEPEMRVDNLPDNISFHLISPSR